MLFFLLLGISLGAVAVVFILQNTAIVTVSFLTWHMDGSLAVILFLAIVAGTLITTLMLLPSFIKDVLSLSSLRKQNKKLEEELVVTKKALAEVHTPPPQPTNSEVVV